MMLGRGLTTALLACAPGLVLAVALAAYEYKMEQAVGAVAFAGTWGLWILGVLYERWEACHLLAHRARLHLLNASVRWAASIEMQQHPGGGWNLDDLKAAAANLSGRNPPSVLRSDHGHVVLVYSDMTVEAHVTERIASPTDVGWTSTLCVKVHPVVFPYRAAHRRFDALVLLLENIERSARPASTKYSVEVDFDEGHNPYFGLYVQRAAPIGRFTWEFVRVFDDGRSRVRVGKTSVAITTQSLAHLAQMYRRYLGLSSLSQPG